jgi:hypothetical protein
MEVGDNLIFHLLFLIITLFKKKNKKKEEKEEIVVVVILDTGCKRVIYFDFFGVYRV